MGAAHAGVRGADSSSRTVDDRGHDAVGKRALTEVAPVQRRGVRPAPEAESMQAAATRGTSGASSSLPYAAHIQALFGRHDISGVQAHLGAEAAAGSQAMGAEAFAMGNHVAFAGAPSLHTAAHEAAHVVQQRSGVQLAGGVGREGDAYEQHADAVADAVVQGKSAEALLDQHKGGGGIGIQHKLTRGSGWGWPGWTDDKAKGIWDDINQRFNTDLPKRIGEVDALGKKKLVVAARAPDVLQKLKTLLALHDDKTVVYSAAPALQKSLDDALTPANELLTDATNEELEIAQRKKAEEERIERERQEELARQHKERDTGLEGFQTRIGKPITDLPFLQSHKPPIEPRRALAIELTTLRQTKQAWGQGEREALELRVAKLETQYQEMNDLFDEEQIRKKAEQSSSSSVQDDVVAPSERAKNYKKTSGVQFGQLSRKCDGDYAVINPILDKVSLGDLGKLNTSLGYVTPAEWLTLAGIAHVTTTIINDLLTKNVPFARAKAMLEATPHFQAVIDLAARYDGDPDNKIVPALSRPNADARNVLALAKQQTSATLLENLAKGGVAHTDVATLLGGTSKQDAALFIEKLPESALLVQLVNTMADPLETRLLVLDVAAKPLALAEIRTRYTVLPAPTTADLYGLAQVKPARGLRTNAGADIATTTLGALAGTNEQASVEATVTHVRGGPKPLLTHAGGAKFGDVFNNDAGRLPGLAGAGGYKEYYCEKDPASGTFHGDRRIVVSDATKHIYYSDDHYASFKRLLV